MLNAFIHPPFHNCPYCGAQKTFGRISVGDEHYIRECKSCGKRKRIRLPPLKKRVIYLDQWFLSDLTKLDDSRFDRSKFRQHQRFFEEANDLLHDLVRLKLVICPASPIHFRESIRSAKVAPKRVLAVLKDLSCGIVLKDPDQVLCHQVEQALDCWISGRDCNHDIYAQEIAKGKINSWASAQLSHDFTPYRCCEQQRFETEKDRRADRLRSVISRWKHQCARSFSEDFEEERRSVANTFRLKWADLVNDAGACTTDGQEDALWRLLGNDRAHLLSRAIRKIDRPEDLREFFQSKEYYGIPAINVEATIWATIAHMVQAGSKNLEDPGLGNDVAFISRYLPYVDVLCVDRALFNALSHPHCKSVIRGREVFCLKNGKESFLKFLRDLRISPEARRNEKLLDEIYSTHGRGQHSK